MSVVFSTTRGLIPVQELHCAAQARYVEYPTAK